MASRTELGELIFRARNARKLSQAALGDACGVSNQQVHRWERGRAIPGRDPIERLAETLDLDLQQLHDLARAADQEDGAEARRETATIKRQFTEVLNEVRIIVADNRRINEMILHHIEALAGEFAEVRRLLEAREGSASH